MRLFIQKVGNRAGQGIQSIARHLEVSETESSTYTRPIIGCTFFFFFSNSDIFVRISIWALLWAAVQIYVQL